MTKNLPDHEISGGLPTRASRTPTNSSSKLGWSAAFRIASTSAS